MRNLKEFQTNFRSVMEKAVKQALHHLRLNRFKYGFEHI